MKNRGYNFWIASIIVIFSQSLFAKEIAAQTAGSAGKPNLQPLRDLVPPIPAPPLPETLPSPPPSPEELLPSPALPTPEEVPEGVEMIAVTRSGLFSIARKPIILC
jgi:hypothetical protein